VQFGRRPKLTQHQQAEGRRRLETGESARGQLPGILIATTPSSRGCGWLRSEGDFGDCPSSRPMSVIPQRAATTACRRLGSVRCHRTVMAQQARTPFHAATGLCVNPLVCLRRFQYAIANMATQHMALIAKQAAIPQSERLMSA
jgi:hypothetical protein